MTFSAWEIIFWATAGIYFVGNVIYVLLLSGSVQSWNYPDGVAPSRPEMGTTEEMKALHRMEERRASIRAYLDSNNGVRRGSSVKSKLSFRDEPQV